MIQGTETMELMLARSGVAYPKGTILHDIGPAGLEALDQVWIPGTYARGRMLLQAEEFSTDVWFLLSGLARVAVLTAGGREVSTRTLGRGEGFGEFAAIDGVPQPTSAEVLTDCIAARVPAPIFREVLAHAPDVSGAYLRRLVVSVRDMAAQVCDMSTQTADVRIRAEILRFAKTAAQGRDRFIIDGPPTQVEIAARVLTNRETVAREMGRMRRMGVIDRIGRRILVPSLVALEAYSKDANAEQKRQRTAR